MLVTVCSFSSLWLVLKPPLNWLPWWWHTFAKSICCLTKIETPAEWNQKAKAVQMLWLSLIILLNVVNLRSMWPKVRSTVIPARRATWRKSATQGLTVRNIWRATQRLIGHVYRDLISQLSDWRKRNVTLEFPASLSLGYQIKKSRCRQDPQGFFLLLNFSNSFLAGRVTIAEPLHQLLDKGVSRHGVISTVKPFKYQRCEAFQEATDL